MTSPASTLAEAVGDPLGGEVLQVVARREVTTVVEVLADGTVQTRHQTQDRVEVTSILDRRSGTMCLTDSSPWAVERAVRVARRLRASAPVVLARPRHGHPLPGPSLAPHVHLTTAEVEAFARDVAGEHRGSAVTVTSSSHRVRLHASDGRSGSHAGTQAQLVVRPDQRTPGVQGTAMATHLMCLDRQGAADELERLTERLSGRRVSPPARPLALLFGPAAAAGLLSQVVSASISPGGALARGDRVGSPALTVVDDPDLAGAPVRMPFDDDGDLTSRLVLVDAGVVAQSLLHDDQGRSAGRVRHGDWDAAGTAAVTNCYLESTVADLALPGGAGVLVERVDGFRGGLDLRAGAGQLLVTGQLVQAGRAAGTVRASVTINVRDLLAALTAVAGPPRFYRLRGVYGGSAALFEGVPLTSV